MWQLRVEARGSNCWQGGNAKDGKGSAHAYLDPLFLKPLQSPLLSRLTQY
jgi:hypothetical protein